MEFIGFIYQYIYIFVVAIGTMSHLNRYRKSVFVPNNRDVTIRLLWVIAVTFFIGFRPVSKAFVDMGGYDRGLRMMDGETFFLTWDTDNKIFDNFYMWWGCNGYDPKIFFLLIAAIYFGCSFFGIKRLFGPHTQLAYLVFLAAFSSFSYGVNGIKAGAATSVFILGLSYWNKQIVCIPLLLVSIGIHHSMIMPIAAYVVVVFFRNPKWFYYLWLICLILAVLHITYFQYMFGGLSDEQGSGYLLATTKTTETHIGFRPDFVIYSAMPVWIGYLFEMKRKIVLSTTYRTLIHFYLTTNAIWMLCMYASFNNRIAYLSWFVYPIVIIYPFLDKKNTDPMRFMKLRKVVLYHLYFTLFMNIVYYGILSYGR